MSLAFNFAARSDVGLVRSNNQDSGYAGPHLLVLADGMGGPAGGDIASSVAVAHLAGLDSDAHPADDLLDLLRTNITAAHDEMVDRATRDTSLHGLGTTVIALLRSGNKLAMCHIGDSRAYLLRASTMTQVTSDHSFVQYLVDTGQLTAEQAENHPQRSVLMRVLGDTEAEVVLDESIREAIVGDRWLLCSDGLSGVVSGETIAEVLDTVPDPGAACDKLIDLALSAGAPDNVTCVVADIVGASDETPLTPQIVGAAATDRLAQSRGSNSAAGRAAALKPASAPSPDDDDDPVPAPNRARRILTRLTATLAVLAVIGGLAWGGYAWSQTQYYVQIDDGQVWIHRGIPQQVGPLVLHTKFRPTGIYNTDLPPFQLDKVSQPITKSSLAEAEAVVDNLRREVDLHRSLTTKPTPSPTPAAPSPTPSPAASSNNAQADPNSAAADPAGSDRA